MKRVVVFVFIFMFLRLSAVCGQDENYTLVPYKTKLSGVSYQRLRFGIAPFLSKAEQAVARSDFKTAYDSYLKALALDTDNYEVKEKLVYVCTALGKRKEAHNYIKDVLVINPSYVPLLLKQAFLYKQDQELEKALEIFLRTYALISDAGTGKEDILEEIVYTAEQVNRDEIVVEYGDKMKKYNKVIEFARIRSLWKQGQYEKALEKLKKFFRKVADTDIKKDIWGYLLEDCLKKKEIERGVSFFENTSEDFYDFDIALNFLYELRRQKQYDAFLEVVSLMQARGTREEKESDVLAYEKAQVLRLSGKDKKYLNAMKKLTDVSGSVPFLKEYAAKLFDEGHYETAYLAIEKIIEKSDDDKMKYEQTMMLAIILLQQGKPKDAKVKLQEALQYGEKDMSWRLTAANIAYASQEYEACIDILSQVGEENMTDRERITLAYCYYKNMMYGISLYNLKQIKSFDMLTREEMYNLYMNTFYILFSYGRYSSILMEMPKADELAHNYSNDILRLKSLTRVSRYDEAIYLCEEILDKYTLLVSERDDVYMELARSLSATAPDNLYMPLVKYEAIINDIYSADLRLPRRKKRQGQRINRYAAAVDLYTKILQNRNSEGAPYYERAMAYKSLGEVELAEKDLYRVFEINKNPPVMAYGDMAAIYTKLGQDKDAVWCFEKYLKFYNYSLDSLSDAGYALMRIIKNDYAACMFSHALDIYNHINPTMEDLNRGDIYFNKAHNLRKELSSLDKVWGLYPFIEINNFDIENEQQNVVRGLPSQAGIELSYRPPVIGFRDYRIFELYAGASTRVEQERLKIERDYTQGVFGARYKPFKPLNFNIALEKHYRIGKFARDDYLLRFMFSDETNKDKHVFNPEKVFINYSFYAELGKFYKHEKERYGYVDFSVGPAKVYKGSGFLITFPRVRVKRRWQDDDTLSTAKYFMWGAGVAARLYEKEKEYFTQRWYFDVYVEYMKGKFEDSPFENDEFSGIVIGVQFLR